MKPKSAYLIPSLLILAVLLGVGIYFLYFRELVAMTYAGNAPFWMNSLTDFFYPRFQIEKHRFDLNFFLRKTDQIIIRFSLVSLLIAVLFFLSNSSASFKYRITNFWSITTSTKNVNVLRIIFFALMLLIYRNIYWEMISLSKAEVFYRPIFWLKTFHIHFPSETGILILYCILVVSCLAAIFNVKAVLFSILAIFSTILIQGYVFSFEKTDHGLATFTYAGLLMPFLLYENSQAMKAHKDLQQGWPLQLILLVICICYLFTGLEKILISKFEWLNPDTFKAYLLLHQAPLGLKVMNVDFLCTTLPALTILFELGFILVLFYKKLRWVFLPAGILFHLSTFYLFDIGGFLNPWMLVYVFFIDWGKIKKSS